MFFRTLILAVFVLSLSTGAARAQEEYATPTWANLVRTLVRFGALDLTDQNLLDEYALVAECDMYREYYPNDFRWDAVRKIIRKSVQMGAPGGKRRR